MWVNVKNENLKKLILSENTNLEISRARNQEPGVEDGLGLDKLYLNILSGHFFYGS